MPGTNRGGTGAPPSALRARLRGSFDERISIAEEIADRAEYSAADRLRAIDLMAKYGLGGTRELTVEGVQERLSETIRVIREILPEEDSIALLDRLRNVWNGWPIQHRTK